MEKYYDLIASMVKAHRKFSEYESILDEIVEDVYEHAKVVLNTVTNEEVINSYLNKLISTSMITVPKRMGIVPERKSRIPAELVFTETSAEQEEVEIVEEQELSEEPSDEQMLLEEEEEAEQNIVEEVPQEVDKSLVDKMINGVSSKSLESESGLSNLPEVADDLDELDELEPVEALDEIPGNLETTVDTDDINNEGEFADSSDDSDITEEPIEEESLEVSEDNNTEDLETSYDGEEDLLEGEGDSLLEADNVLQEDLVQDIEEGTLESHSEGDSDIDNQVSEDGFEKPSFECFRYNPRKEESDSRSEIEEELKNIDSSYPDLHIMEICKLKFEENMSLRAISEELGCSQEKVQEALDKIVSTVKD